ncbi:MAG: hypothetical protein R3B46_07765 [Phycisphaerales bacterium]
MTNNAPDAMTREEPTTTGSGWKNRGILDERLRDVIARARWASRGRRTGAAVWPVPVAIIAALLIDASLALPSILRAGIAVAILALALRVLLALIPSRDSRRMNALRAARITEERAHITHNALINAVQLRALAANADATMPAELARRAVAQGDQRAASLSLAGLIDTAPIKRAWGWSLLALALFAIAWLSAPRLFAMGIPRLTEPFADHPPFTRTNFDISWEPQRPLAADAITIRVALTGPLPDALDFIALDDHHNPIDRAPMTPQFARTDASTSSKPSDYTFILRDLRAPARFFVQGSTGRSRIITITPEMRPRIESAQLRITPPAYTDLPEVAHTGASLTADRSPIPVLVGSTITFTVNTTIDLESVNQPDTSVTAGASVSSRTAIQQTRFDSPGQRDLTLQPVAVGGLVCDEIATARILVVEDQPPAIRIDQPTSATENTEIFVLEGASFPLVALATDDVALTRFTLHRTLTRNNDQSLPVDLEFAVDPRTRAAEARTTLSTADLGAIAGDSVTLSLSATDNRAPEFGAPQTTTSPTITVRVMNREDFARRFAEELAAQDITRPYDQLARAAEALDQRAQDLRAEARELSRDLDRLPADQQLPEPLARAARALQQRIDQFNDQRQSLADEVQRRLDAPDAVDFDAQMRQPLERLRDRLDAMQTPSLPRLDEPQPNNNNNGDQDNAEQPSDPNASNNTPSPQLDRARVGQWLDKAEQATEQSAQQSALAADEAALDITRPARALELADQLQRTLEQVDDAARRQRMLADRLATLTELDETAADELATSQESIQAQLEQSIRDLRKLGDRAEHELGSTESPSQLARAILDERAKVQQAIDDITAATSNLPAGIGAQSIRQLIDKSANLVLDEVYRQTLPITDALSTIDAMPARDDDPAAEILTPTIEDIRRALEILDQIEQYLDEARDAHAENGGSTVALHSLPHALAIITLAASPTHHRRPQLRHQRRHRSRTLPHRAPPHSLRQVELGLSPLLPTMGAPRRSPRRGHRLLRSCPPPWSPQHPPSRIRPHRRHRARHRSRRGGSKPSTKTPANRSPANPASRTSISNSNSASPPISSNPPRSPLPPSSQQQSDQQSPTDGQSMSSGQRPSTLEQLAQNRQQHATSNNKPASNQTRKATHHKARATASRASPCPRRSGITPGRQRPRAVTLRFFNETLYQSPTSPRRDRRLHHRRRQSPEPHPRPRSAQQRQHLRITRRHARPVRPRRRRLHPCPRRL